MVRQQLRLRDNRLVSLEAKVLTIATLFAKLESEVYVPYKGVRAKGVTFVFKYEEDYPEILHIFARHLKEPDDAIEIFFKGLGTWNTRLELWETRYQRQRIRWFWIDEKKKVVMIVTCFDK